MRTSLILLASTMMVCLTAPAQGGQRRLWSHDAVNAFGEGEKEGVSVSQRGIIQLSPAINVLLDDLGQAVFDVLPKDGAIYAATGNEGKIYRLRLKGNEKTVALDIEEPWVLSLARGHDGSVYAGTGPGGKVYRETEAGEWEVFAELEATYVWALVPDGKGRLLAATGDTGRIFRLDAAGKAQIVLDAGHGHILCLTRGDDGSVYAGSDDTGIIYRIPVEGEASVAYDAQESEIRAIAAGPGGVVYFGTADIGASGAERDKKQAKEGIASELLQTMTGEQNAGLRGAVAQKGPERKKVTGKNRLYRLEPSGHVVRLWEFPEKVILSIAVEGESVYVGTGFDGFIYRLDENRDCAEVAKLEKGEVMSLAFDEEGRLLVGTSNDAQVLAMLDGHVKEGVFTATVLDAKVPATWGEARWTADTPKGTAVEVSTRSGNSEEPDGTWSPWGKWLPDADGSPVDSPPARFLQYRVRLSTKDPAQTPVFRRLELAYLGANLPPRITTLSMTPADDPEKGGKPAKGAEAGASGDSASAGSAGRLQIVWGAEDPNADDLDYTLEFRGEGERNWKMLAEQTTETKHVWDTTLVPDGIYELRLTASDAPSNAAGEAKRHEKRSDYFRVDNTPPVIEKLEAKVDVGGVVRVKSTATDGAGRVRGARYSLDGGSLERVNAKDGIADGASEEFHFELDGLTDGEHTLVLVVEDDAGNHVAGKQVIRVEGAQE